MIEIIKCSFGKHYDRIPCNVVAVNKEGSKIPRFTREQWDRLSPKEQANIVKSCTLNGNSGGVVPDPDLPF